jgi:hypothetical protein
MKEARIPRSVKGDEWRFLFMFWKLAGFREAVMPRPIAGDHSHEATYFTCSGSMVQFINLSDCWPINCRRQADIMLRDLSEVI